MTQRFARRLKIAALLATSFCASNALAANQTWIQANANNNWSTTDTNWDAGVGWTQGNSAIFGGTLDSVTLTEAINAGGLTFNVTGYTIAGTSPNILTLIGTPTITVTNSADSATITAVVAGSAGFTKSGAGTLLFGSTNNNTYTGQTIISSGTLKLNGLTASATLSNALGAGGAGNETIVQSGATLDINGHLVNNTEIIRIAGTGVGGNGALINTTAGNAALTNLNRVDLTANATIGGSQRFDIRGGTTPQLNLGGFKLTKVGAAQFSVVGGAISSGDIDINAGTFSIESTSTLSGAGLAPGTVTVNTATLAFYGTTGTNITRPIVANAGATISNLGSAAGINSPITVVGNTSFSGGTANTFGGPLTLGTGATATVSGALHTFNGVISGGGAMSYTFNGHYVQPNLTNNYSGGTTISNTRLFVSTFSSALGTGTVTVIGDGTNPDGQLYAGAATISNNLILSGFGLNTADTNPRGALRLDGGTVNGSVTLSANAGLGVNSGTGTINGVVNGGGFTLTKVDAGTLVLNGDISNVANLQIGTAAIVGNALTIGGAATINGGTFAGTITAPNAATSIFNYGSSSNQLISGAISNSGGALAVNKTGSGILTLSGTNTYTGATGVTVGTLKLTGTLTSAINVSGGASLTGGGSTTGDIALSSGAVLVADGSVAVQGANVTTGGAITSYVTAAPTGAAATVNLIRYTGTTPGTANFSAGNYRAGSIADSGSAITLTYTGEAKTWGAASTLR